MTAPIWTPCTVTLGALQPWAANPRLSTKAQAKRILASFARFGQVQTVAIGPANEVYDGHQRLSALLTVHGPDHEIDARRASRPLDDDERRALVLILHAGAAGAWNWDDLAGWDAAQLQAGGLDADYLKTLNADAAALATMLESEQPPAVDAEPQIDRAEELRAKWGVEPGQLWKLGEHRLICGDCTDAGTVALLMQGERATLAPVDPPYNVGFEYDGETVDDKKTAEKYEEFTRAWFGVCQSVSDRQIVTPGCNNLASWLRWFDAKHWAPWTKSNSMTNGVVSRFWCWEPVLFFGDKWPRNRSNDLFNYPISNQTGVANHPCPKPLPMWVDLVENYSEPGEIILDSFGGSGTTLLACEQTGRRCRAVEISPAYVAVALERWAEATGKTPELVDALEVENGRHK